MRWLRPRSGAARSCQARPRPQVWQIAFDALLGEPPPPDWNDPSAVAARRDRLAEVARAAGDATVELLARLPDERRRGVHMAEDRCVMAVTDATIALQLVRYQRDTVRWDGRTWPTRPIEDDVAAGAGVADLTLWSLGQLRGEIGRTTRERWEGPSFDGVRPLGRSGAS